MSNRDRREQVLVFTFVSPLTHSQSSQVYVIKIQLLPSSQKLTSNLTSVTFCVLRLKSRDEHEASVYKVNPSSFSPHTSLYFPCPCAKHRYMQR